jgi:uncharacterized membrane protein
MRKSVARSFRANVITGILVLAPIGAVLGIVLWFMELVTGMLGLVPQELRPKSLFGLESGFALRAVDGVFTLFLLALVVLLVWLVGLISRNYFGKKLFDSIAAFVARVPVLRTVYSTLEQLLATFASGHTKNFRRVVQVEYPRKGLFTLAFVTGERGRMLTIYVPTTPNPTSGFYLMVDADEVREADMTVEDALKEVISLGMVHKNG